MLLLLFFLKLFWTDQCMESIHFRKHADYYFITFPWSQL